MSAKSSLFWSLLWGLPLVALATSALSRAPQPSAPPSRPDLGCSATRPGGGPAPAVLARLPLRFEPNAGQGPGGARFLSHGPGYSLALHPQSVALTLSRAGKGAPRPATVSMSFVGANPSARLIGAHKLLGNASYQLGPDPSKWQRHLSTYGKVRYERLYPGTDLVYYGNDRQLEYDFVLAPGADPGRIQLAFTGARKVRVDDTGDLVLDVAGTEVRQHKPVVYQQIAGERRAVAGRYALEDGRVGFRVGRYDRSRPLVIDPTISFSTYVGGGDYDIAQDIAVDPSGNTWITGVTYYGGSRNIFVRKLNPTGTALLLDITWGDAGDDEGSGIAVDAAGNVYVTGKYSYPWDFDPSIYLDHRLFVAKLSPAGDVLYYAAPEGSMDDKGNDIAVDAFGYAYVTGYAQGGHVRGFPIVNGFQTQASSPVYQDGIVLVLNPTGTNIVYSSYIAGGTLTQGTGIAVDAQQRFYVTGTTGGNIPITAGAFQTRYGGYSSDAFVMKIDPTRSGTASLVYSTYLGGDDFDQGNAIAVDAAGNAYVTGATNSNQASVPFPTTAGAYQSGWGGGDCDSSPYFQPCPDAFAAKLNATGSALLYSTYIGGLGSDTGTGIAIDTAGNAYIAGWGSGGYPTVGALQAFGGGKDVVVTKLNPTGSALIWSTFLGGGDYDQATALARDAAGNVFVTGYTASTNYPVTTGAFHNNYWGGGEDPFVTRLTDSTTAAATLSAVSLSPTSVTGGTPSVGTVTLTSAAPAGGTVVTLATNTAAAAVPASVTVAAGAKTATFSLTTSAVGAPTTATVTAAGGGVQKSASLTINPPALSGLTLTLATVVGGNNATGNVTLTGPAPTGGVVVALSSSNAAVAGVPASVTVPAGVKTTSFAVTTQGVATPTSVTLTATQGGVTRSASLTVSPAALSALSLSPSSVTGGATSKGTVTLTGAAPAGGATVTLSSGGPAASVPASVVVPAGAKTASVTIGTLVVTADTPTPITASYGGVTKSATLTVKLAALSGLTLNPTSVAGGNNATGTVTLTGPAPTGGVVVALTSGNPAASVPANVTVAAGAKTATFTAATSVVTADTLGAITGTSAGVSKSANLTVKPAALSAVGLSPSSVTGGATATGTVTLTGPAPASGVVVTLSSASAAAGVPASVTVPAGAKTGSFTITTQPVTADTGVLVSAVYGGVTRSATLTVKRTTMAALTLSPTTVKGGVAVTGTVTLLGAAPAGGAVVALASSNAPLVPVPASITIPAGAKTGKFTVTPGTVAANTPVTLTASLNATSKTATVTVTP